MKNSLGSHFLSLDEIDSTQLLAQRMLRKSELQHGLVISAKKQTHGKGRLNRFWSSPEGGLWMTVIIQKPLPSETLSGLSVKLGVAFAEALNHSFSLPVKVRWPNDLMLGGKKLGGLLVDLHTVGNLPPTILVGVGLNVNNPVSSLASTIRSEATSIVDFLGREVSLAFVQEILLTKIQTLIDTDQTVVMNDVLQKWSSFSFTSETEVQVTVDGEILTGKETGLSNSFELRIVTKEGLKHKISSGNVELLRKL